MLRLSDHVLEKMDTIAERNKAVEQIPLLFGGNFYLI